MVSSRIFLTGEPGSGKTTAVRRICNLLKDHGVKIGGLVSGEICEDGARVGFMLEDVATHTVGTLAHINIHGEPRVGMYGVSLTDISRVGVPAITSALSDSGVIIIDEIGPMELCSLPFVKTVERALNSSRIIVGTIHRRAAHPLVRSIKADRRNEILEVTSQNRDQIPSVVDENLRKWV